jgi:hypothetical protein
MTAANDLGLTTAVPARIEVLADVLLKPIKIDNQEMHFKYAASSRLYWADRPAMRVVQALHWMLLTGTPSGVGHAQKPHPVWMKAGDVCEIEVEGIRVLRNPIENEA